jgi:hypothetical protein
MTKVIKFFCYCRLWFGVNVIGLPEVVELFTEVPAKRIVTQKSKFHK